MPDREAHELSMLITLFPSHDENPVPSPSPSQGDMTTTDDKTMANEKTITDDKTMASAKTMTDKQELDQENVVSSQTEYRFTVF